MQKHETDNRSASAEQGGTSDPLSNATPEQLAACLRVLADNVAQYRLQLPGIPLRKATPGAASGPEKDQATSVLKEVMELISRKEEPTAPKAPHPARLVEHREYARINIRIPVRVTVPGSKGPVTGKLNDLSWGGASFSISGLGSPVGDEIRLDLPFIRGGEDISITARILRVSGQPQAQSVAVRFTSLTPEDDKRLERVLLLLLEQKNGDRRQHPRLARRIEVEYTNEFDWRATLENISQGGMCLTLPDPVKVEQSVQLMLSETSRSASLTLRGRVIDVEKVDFSGTKFYQVRLEFEHPSETLQKSIKSLLQSMAVAKSGDLPRAFM